MPDEPNGAVAQQQPASAEPASNSPAAKPDETVTMSKAEFDAFIKAQTEPWQKRYSDLEADHGRLKKRSSLSQDDVARIADAEKNFESMKRIVTALGVSEDDIKDAESVRDLELLLRGYGRQAADKPKGKDAPTPEGYAAYLEWLKTQQGQGQGQIAAKPTLAGFTQTGVRGGSVPPLDYKERLKSGQPLPSPEEIDRITAAFLR